MKATGSPPIAHDIDVAIVGELGIEDRGDAAEQGAAGVGGELGVGDLAGLLRGGERLALEEAVGIGDGAVREGEAMQHGEPVEPMIIGAGADLEL